MMIPPVALDLSAPPMQDPLGFPGDDDDDSILARKLQQELDDEDLARRLAENNNVEHKPPNTDQLHVGNDDDAMASLPIFRETPVTDEEMARQAEQESRDEHLTHQLTLQETRINGITRTMGPIHRCTARRVCGLVTCFLIAAAVSVATLLVVVVGGSGLDLIGMNPSFAQNDPHFNKTNVIPWNNGGHGGLKLQVVNALDTKWYPEFQKAVSQWDNGDPDALTLSTNTMSPDSTCSQLMGKLKVCNGNYGATYWLGINEQLIQNGWLISSTARMNDFYLDHAIESQRQYTMCHEIGHGFGLPHTDENFYNADLGNCLDYTIHPWINERPSAVNFDLLNKTYGAVGTRRRELADPANEIHHPNWVMRAFTQAVRRLREVGHEHAKMLGWKIIHKSPYGEIHSRQLGADYRAHVHIMFVTNHLP